jgi:hypothetical protein
VSSKWCWHGGFFCVWVSQLDDITAENAKLKESNAALEAEVSSSREQLAELRRSHAAHGARTEEVTAELADLRQRVKVAEAELAVVSHLRLLLLLLLLVLLSLLLVLLFWFGLWPWLRLSPPVTAWCGQRVASAEELETVKKELEAEREKTDQLSSQKMSLQRKMESLQQDLSRKVQVLSITWVSRSHVLMLFVSSCSVYARHPYGLWCRAALTVV